jgi:uncharacterized protein YjdB
MLFALGCSRSAVSPSTPQLASVKIVPDVSLVKIGTVTQFSYLETAVEEGAPPTGPPPAWSTSDDSIARVDSSGRVTAIAPGTASLTLKLFGQLDTRVLQVMP